MAEIDKFIDSYDEDRENDYIYYEDKYIDIEPDIDTKLEEIEDLEDPYEECQENFPDVF